MLYFQGIHSDVNFEVSDTNGISKTYRVHKIILSACSTFFRNMLGESTKMQAKLQLNLDNHVTFDNILKYAYHGEVVIDEANFKDFMAALNAFEMVPAVKQVLLDAFDANSCTD